MLKFVLRFVVIALALWPVRETIVAQQLSTVDTGVGFVGYNNPTSNMLPSAGVSLPSTYSTSVAMTPSVIMPTVSATASRAVILLNNDQVVSGEILDTGEVVQVRTEFGVVQIRRNEIALTAPTLHDVYQAKSSKIPKNSAAFIKLADWCVACKLKDEASYEFDRAILWAENRQLADSIRNRKKAALSMFEGQQIQTELTELAQQENAKYLHWKERIPQATFTTFKREIFPMLVQNCSGIACHSANSLNDFRFAPGQQNNDVDVAKNLQIVLGYVAPGATEESPLVLVPIAPHGRTKQIFTQRNYRKYEKLYYWADRVAGEMHNYYPLDDDDHIAVKNQSRHSTFNSDTGMMFKHASDDNVTFPSPGEQLVDDTLEIQERSVDQPSSMSQGMARNTGIPTKPRAEFDFFNQQTVVVPGTPNGALPRPIPAHLEQPKEKVVMTHGSTDAFERYNTLQQLQHDPVDPFDPVLFNRQYHLKRIEEKLRIGDANTGTR